MGNCPPLSPVGIVTASCNPEADCSNPPLPRNNMTAASTTSETLTDVNSVAQVTSEVPDADVSSAVASFLTHVRNSENPFTQNQISQSNHLPNTELDRSIEATLQ